MRLWPLFGKVPDPEPPDIDEEDDGEEDESPEEHRRHYVLAFRLVRKETEHRIEQLTHLLGTGELDTKEWAQAFRKELRAMHSEGWALGRKLAGHVGAQGEDDTAAGAIAWERQEPFFQKLLADVENGRYTKKGGAKPAPKDDDSPEKGGDEKGDASRGELNEKALNARAKKYVASVRGTVHESFRVALGKELTEWHLGTAEHCRPSKDYPYNCPDLAAESPKPADEWQTAPARGDCPCGGNCGCFLSSGRFSTEGI